MGHSSRLPLLVWDLPLPTERNLAPASCRPLAYLLIPVCGESSLSIVDPLAWGDGSVSEGSGPVDSSVGAWPARFHSFPGQHFPRPRSEVVVCVCGSIGFCLLRLHPVPGCPDFLTIFFFKCACIQAHCLCCEVLFYGFW